MLVLKAASKAYSRPYCWSSSNCGCVAVPKNWEWIRHRSRKTGKMADIASGLLDRFTNLIVREDVLAILVRWQKGQHVEA